MTARTDRCPGCHGSGIEPSGVTYAGMSEYVGCGECGPDCAADCGCRVDDATERPESVALRHPGATQSPDGSPSATQGLRGPERAVTDAELVAYEAAAAAAYEAGLLGGMSREERAARHAALARGAESVPSAAQIGAESITVDVRRWASHMADRLDQAEAENARMVEWNAITTRAFETTRRVLQEASGLPDDIDDPDCRDEMVLALRPRAEKAEAEVARLAEEATVSAALLETEIAKREAAEMRANRATADLDALESEDRRQDVQAKHWREVLRIRRELDGIRREMNDVTEIIAEALGYRPSGLPLDGWPHLSTTGDHTPTSLAAEAAGVLAKASRLRAGIEALAAEWHQAYDPDPIVLTNRMRAADLRALLADTDSAKDEGGE